MPDIRYRRIKWLTYLRLIITTLTLVSGALVLQISAVTFYIFISLICFLTIIYLLMLRVARLLNFLAYLQILIDVILITFMVHYSGGIESSLVMFYILPIAYSGTILSSRASTVTTVTASLLYSMMVALEFFRIIPRLSSGGDIDIYNNGFLVVYLLYIRITIFGLVSFLHSYLLRGLKERSAEVVSLRRLNECILKNMGSGLIATNKNDAIIYMNQAAEMILGCEIKDVWESNISSLFGEGAVDISHQFAHKEIKFNKENGKVIPIGYNVSELKDEDGNGRGKVFVFRDLTVIKDMEERIRRQERFSAVGEMATGLAHEIRNPLASISGSVEMLRNDCLNKETEHSKLMDIILKETDRLNGIVSGFLDFARSRPVKLGVHNLNEILNECIMLIKNDKQFNQKVNIIYSYKDGTHPPWVDDELTSYVDAEEIKQVFLNILINACDAMPDGGNLTVTTYLENLPHQGEFVGVSFSDTGCGIRNEDLKRIFEPFRTTKYKGIGIGLAIANRIVQNHNGSIDVESEFGRGSKFIVRLPRYKKWQKDS
ncbi:MAG: PAS domain S-box protein [Candidatus Omnitrophica bacterium]|nr:PAS domain S-box protein [Candidatus Omnitrophota bacterium]